MEIYIRGEMKGARLHYAIVNIELPVTSSNSDMKGIGGFRDRILAVIYTTNAIESLNIGFRRLNRGRMVFPNAVALTKALYLATWELTKNGPCPSATGAGLRGAGYHVSRQADPELAVCRDRNGGRAFNRRQP